VTARTIQRTSTVTFAVPGLPITPLTVAAPCIADTIAAILDHVRPDLPANRPVYVVINPGGRGHLWDGRYIIGTLLLTGGAS
jgi:queuine/archaeosine tRNA-ribosyltransferase